LFSGISTGWIHHPAGVIHAADRLEVSSIDMPRIKLQALKKLRTSRQTHVIAAVHACNRLQCAIEMLCRVWVQQYYARDGLVYWRTEKEGIPPARLVVSSPYDLDARLGRKRKMQWVGYKVYLTETCDHGRPHLITHVAMTAAPVADGAVTPEVHRTLKDKKLLPGIHLVHTGFLDAALLVVSRRDYGVDLVGPTRPDYKWQKRARTGFEAGRFIIDWEKQEAIC